MLAAVRGQLLPLPINCQTLNRLYGLQLDEAGAEAFLARVRAPRSPLRSSEDVVLAAIGRATCVMLFPAATPASSGGWAWPT